jgi:hypothetical protein
MQEIGAI